LNDWRARDWSEQKLLFMKGNHTDFTRIRRDVTKRDEGFSRLAAGAIEMTPSSCALRPQLGQILHLLMEGAMRLAERCRIIERNVI
jgi:hypothetical protein